MISGTVTRVELEGGFFGIITDGAEALYPVDLPDEFKEDGLAIRFEAEDAAVFTTAMWGRTVSVSSVERA